MHQGLRDIGLILPDLLHVVLTLIEYKNELKGFGLISDSQKAIEPDKIKGKDVLASFLLVCFLWLVGASIPNGAT